MVAGGTDSKLSRLFVLLVSILVSSLATGVPVVSNC
jgi:hypothetical protein